MKSATRAVLGVEPMRADVEMEIAVVERPGQPADHGSLVLQRFHVPPRGIEVSDGRREVDEGDPSLAADLQAAGGRKATASGQVEGMYRPQLIWAIGPVPGLAGVGRNRGSSSDSLRRRSR